ncbi:hypothetical protein SAMN04488511_105118 [Pedobacter suwonensis]|uniref:Uncharacterized protein n=1 Tax=Pedobacter suwonensis TaxID=332999 RepID=A0A1I0T1S5_9SPHI|nr:hypothetical protein SAMN04488511_105118 [Pedobacter suwonensis]
MASHNHSGEFNSVNIYVIVTFKNKFEEHNKTIIVAYRFS